MSPKYYVAAELAKALLLSTPGAKGPAERIEAALGQSFPWIPEFAQRMMERFGFGLGNASSDALFDFILDDPGYCKAWEAPEKPRIRRFDITPPAMAPRPGVLIGCALPNLAAPGDLAAWLAVTPAELDWYADRRGMIRATDGGLCHYHYQMGGEALRRPSAHRKPQGKAVRDAAKNPA